MRGSICLLGLVAAISAASPARAEIINLSCDDGGMLLLIDTSHLTITDTNPFQRTKTVVPLTMTADAFIWHEGSGESAADYRMDRATGIVSATVHGGAVSLSNPKCGKSAVLIPKS